jgi:PAS domain S-box-containing protein
MQVAPDGGIMVVNRAIEAMFGYDRSELIGQNVDMLVPDRFRGGHERLRRDFLGDPKPRLMGSGRDIVARRKDASEFVVEVGLNPITADGQASVVVAIVDISARHAARLELERQREELERSNADLDEFAHAASHDLKAPLRGMSHLAEWIAEDVASIASPKTLENCALLRARALRMQGLLDGLLTYSRVVRTKARVETFDTAQMVEDLIATLALPGGFTVSVAGEMPSLTTERVPLERVLQNLIENAVKHHDRQVGRVLVTANRDGAGRCRFSVSDDGPGIAPRHHKRIFQVFQTLTRRDEVEASGIGLAIVKKHIENRGGRIAVESAPPERGTRFVFTWPEMQAP